MRQMVHRVFDPDPQSRYLDRFGWLLILTYLTIAGQMLVNVEAESARLSQEVGSTLVQIVATAMFLLVLHACGVSRRWRVALTTVALFGLAGRLLILTGEIVTGHVVPVREVVAPWGTLILMALTFFFVGYRLTRHRTVTPATLLGSVTAYLLIPLVFYYVFLCVNAVQSTPFFGQPMPGTEFMFFSLTTVTTLGYGDPKPATDLGQLLSTSEALIGQLYLVIVVAMIVGLMITKWDRRTK